MTGVQTCALPIYRDFWKQQLVKNGINPDARAEDLGLLDWENLAKIWYN